MAVMADNQCVLVPDHTTVNYLLHNGVLLRGRPTWGARAIYTLRTANVGLFGTSCSTVARSYREDSTISRYRVARDRLGIHDLHAPILRLTGIDYQCLTYQFGGRNFRLTAVHGRVFNEVLVYQRQQMYME